MTLLWMPVKLTVVRRVLVLTLNDLSFCSTETISAIPDGRKARAQARCYPRESL